MTKNVKPTGTSKGGRERAKRLSPAERAEIARNAALTRWAGSGPGAPIMAAYGAPDRPLKIGNIEMGCYVLADTTRVLSMRGLQTGLGLSEGGGKLGARKIPLLMAKLAEDGIDIRGLIARANSPIRFLPPGGGIADGYEATLLPDLCAVLIEAGRRGKLGARNEHLAERAGILQHGFATVGIIALVDEATGYQEYRERDALARILEAFVQEELRPYLSQFRPEYYRQIYRLNGWEYTAAAGKPGVIGHWTNNIIYKRLAPGILKRLREVTPRNSKGRLKNKLFQRLTWDIGEPKLQELLTAVIMLMKYSPDWRTFMDRLDREFPQYGDTLMLPFPPDYDPPAIRPS